MTDDFEAVLTGLGAGLVTVGLAFVIAKGIVEWENWRARRAERKGR